MFNISSNNDKINIQCINNKLINDYHIEPLTKSNSNDIINLSYNKNNNQNEDFTINLNFNNNNYTAFPYTGNFFRCLIGGSSGSGKSTLCYNLLNLMNYNNDNKLLVFYVSPIINDDDLDNHLKKIFTNNVKIFEEMEDDKYNLLLKHINPKEITLIKINQQGLINFIKQNKGKPKESILNIQNNKQNNKPNYLFTVENLNKFTKKHEFNNCCIVFDDCDTFTDKKYKKFVDYFTIDILQRGRKHTKDETNINCLTVKHELGLTENKILYMECEYVYFNLKVIHQQRLKYICSKFNLDSYLDFLTERKEEGDNLTCLSTKYPFYFFTNKIIKVVS